MNGRNLDQASSAILNTYVYYARIPEIEGADLKDKIIENSKNMQAELLSTYDQIKLEGKVEGKLEGKVEGKLEGKIEAARAFAEKMILHFPSWPDERIADLSGASLKEIAKLRRKLSAKKRPVLPKKKANGPNGPTGTISK